MDIRTMMVALGRKIRTWLELDYMEYSSDANAQAAYVTNAVNTGADDSLSKLLIHFDGADAATTYTAETGQTVTFAGNAQLDTAQKKFGSSSLLLDGSGDYVTVPDSDDWYFGSGDFTIDCWVMFASPLQDEVIISQCSEWGPSNYWMIKYYSGLSQLQMSFNFGGVGKGVYNLTSFVPTTGIWYHFACERIGTVGKIFINGVSQTLTEEAAFGTNDVGNVGAVLQIGAIYGNQTFNGWIDEVRISKGIARWTANFTPQTWNYMPLQCGSESTIKTQGSYALKAIATTSALNRTLTRTVSPTINLTGINTIKFDIRSTRTGSNIKIGIHDSGGTTTEHTPNILEADVFQTETVDISAVADANKDAIDSLITTILNADATNTIYIDNVRYS